MKDKTKNNWGFTVLLAALVAGTIILSITLELLITKLKLEWFGLL